MLQHFAYMGKLFGYLCEIPDKVIINTYFSKFWILPPTRILKKCDKHCRALCHIASVTLDSSVKLQKINQWKNSETHISEI